MTRTPKQSATGSLVNFAVAMVGFLLLSSLLRTGGITRYWQGILMNILINILLAVSLNLTTGYLGQLALGHAGFMSVGAYVSAILSKNIPMGNDLAQLVLALVAGGLAAAVCGLIIGIPALRLKGDYLAIITLGFGEIIRVIVENLEITGGAQGLRSIPKIAKLPVVYWVVIGSVALLYTLIRSRHGRAIVAIREDEIAAESSGIHVTNYKIMAFAIAAFLAGVAGAIYAHYLGLLAPRTFDFNKSIEIVVIVVLGGMGSMTGSIVAATGLTLLSELLRGFSSYRMLLYSLALILVMIFRPGGLLGSYEFSLMDMIRRLGNKLGGHGESQPLDRSKEDEEVKI